jgi:anaerobic ribonucleoside-triphosphate reductase activating protein
MSESMALSRVHFPVTTLGPGQRLGIWFQGCSIQCPGCISTDTWSTQRGHVAVTDVLEAVAEYARMADGVTISGGEPFEQPEALGELLLGLSFLRKPGSDVLVYSGLPYGLLVPWLDKWQGLIDVVISEPFDRTAPQTRPLMGSDNQSLHMLTDLGRTRFAEFERTRDARDDQIDLMFDENGTAWMAGIPRRGDLERLQALVASRGIVTRITEQVSR